MKLLTKWYSFLALGAMFLWLPNILLPTNSLRVVDVSQSDMKNLSKGFLLSEPEPLKGQARRKAIFGKKLFFDKNLSANSKVSCSSCHDPKHDFTDKRPLAVGIGSVTRNSPTIVNSRYNNWFYWDGRADSLALQALGPLEHSKEQGSNRGRIVSLVQENYAREYKQVFGEFPKELRDWWSKTKKIDAYPMQINPLPSKKLTSYALATIDSHSTQTDIINSAASAKTKPQTYLAQLAAKGDKQNEDWISNYNDMPERLQKILDREFFKIGSLFEAYQNRIVATNSPFDRFARKLQKVSSEKEAYSEGFGPEEYQGFKVFLSSGCTSCHNGPNFTDSGFHNIGLPWFLNEIQWGRSLGAMKIKESDYSCENNKRDESIEESCLELKYLDLKQYDSVGAFKTPSLRNLSKTAPYMHHGIFKNLDEVINHYDKADTVPAVGHTEESLQPIGLSQLQKDQLKAFLNSLNSEVKEEL